MRKQDQLTIRMLRSLMLLAITLLIPAGAWAQDYGLTIGNESVTRENAADIFGDGTVAYDYDTKTLTLNKATITMTSAAPLVQSSLENLTIVLSGGRSDVWWNNVPSAPTAVFVSMVENATLTFKSTNGGELYINNNVTLYSGFTAPVYENSLIYSQNSDWSCISPLAAPNIYGMLNGFTNQWRVEIGSGQEGTIKYSLTYADENLAENNKTDEEYTEAFTLLGPATITATVTVDGTESSAATAYYFGVLPNSVQLSYEGTTPPTFAATLSPNVEGVTLTPTSVSQNIGSISEGVMTISGMGKGTVWANVSHEDADYTVISDTIVFQMAVLPPVPTIVFDNTKDYLNTDKVSITMPEALAEYENARIMYSWVEDCADGNGTNYDEDTQVVLTAGTGTLYAWVRYDGATIDDAVYSARTSQVFNVKSDISQASVPDFTTSATYTGEAITPEFMVQESEKTQVVLDAENYTVSYQKVGEQTEDVEAIVDAGTYVITITGTSSTWGGKKTVTREFTVTKAGNELTTAPAAIEGLIYTGTPLELVTAGVAAFGDVQYKLGINGTYSTEIPTATDADTYIIYYKVEGNDNFAGIEEASIEVSVGSNPLTSAFATNQTWATYYNTGDDDIVLPTGINAYIVTGISGSIVTLQAISNVPQDVPVLLEKNETVSGEIAESLTGLDNELVGTADRTDVSTITDGTVYVLYNGAFVKSTSGTIPAGKAYLVLDGVSAGNAPMMLLFSFGATGIKAIDGGVWSASDALYDLNGRKISGKPAKKGLYIVNGKTTVVK